MALAYCAAECASALTGKRSRMSFQHLYRRGHVFWWRRIHRLSDSRTLDLRLSLRTYERSQAVSRGAALTAATGGVIRMLEGRIRAAAVKPTEEELQSLAKAAYDELLVELCTTQRSEPYNAEHHSAINHACVDYYDRLIRNGGHRSLMREEELKLASQGWDERRIAALREIVKLREDRNVTRFRAELIDPKLQAIGFEPTDELRWITELVLYPAFRDAHLEAEASLQRVLAGRSTGSTLQSTPMPGFVPTASPAPPTPSPHSSTPGVLPAESTIPEDWRFVTPTAAAEKLIQYRPALWEHRKKSKRAIAQVGEQTLRQIRWAATLLEKSTGGRPLWTITQEDLKSLDKWFDRLPITFGKAPWHRKPETTLEDVCLDAAERIEEGEYDADAVGLEVGTTNKHYRKLAQIHDFMREQTGNAVPALKFSDFISPDLKSERDGCTTYTVEQGKELFQLPPWTGCQSVQERLRPGEEVFHDALFFVLLLVWYTGMRREEVCKLLVDDVLEYAGIWHIHVRFTEAGRVKNTSSVR
ncbi:MAG TPA: hypothetical protein VKY80_06425, partial [Croceibacterium sp.]|nr:hypothetical protein [Croceibacterium sp.]